MPRYNIALLPPDNIAQKLYHFCDKYLDGLCDGYQIDPERALAHITLCQFRTDVLTPDLIQKLQNFPFDFSKLSLSIAGFYTSHTTSENHQNHIWTGFFTMGNGELNIQQAAIHAMLLQQDGCDPLTASSPAYFPHLTVGRHKKDVLLPSISGEDMLFDKDISGWCLSLGEADNNGVYLSVVNEF